MQSGFSLDAHDQTEVDRRLDTSHEAIRGPARRAGFSNPLDYLLCRWSAFVAEVEVGYGFSIYDYMDDLTVRDIVMDVQSGLSEVGQDEVRRAFAPYDERFASATETRAEPLLREQPGRALGWWWNRSPRVLLPELGDDLAGWERP